MANDETLTSELTSIVGMLPADAQRLVSEHLPRLEALVDEEITSYGDQLSAFLEGRVGKVASTEKATIERVLRELGDARPSDDERESLETGLRGSLEILRRELADSETVGGRTSHRDAAARLVSHLREAVQRLQQDVSAGLRGTGVRTFRDSLERWRDGLDEPIQLTDTELAELLGAATALPEMANVVEFKQGGNRLTARTADAAGNAAAIHESVREACASEGDLNPPPEEVVARTLRRIQSALDGLAAAQGEDETESADQLRTLARSARQAALNLDKEMRIGPIGVITRFAEAWHKGQAVARDRSAIEGARAACAKACAYYGARAEIGRVLAVCATDSGRLKGELDGIATDVGTLEALIEQHADERHQVRMLEASVGRLAHLVEQTAAHINDRATAKDAEAASNRVKAVREELDVLTEIAATTKANLDKAVALIEASERFWRDRDEGVEAMRRAVRDGVRAAKLPSASSSID